MKNKKIKKTFIFKKTRKMKEKGIKQIKTAFYMSM